METVTQKPAPGQKRRSCLFLEGWPIALGIDILHQFKEVFVADMSLLRIGQETFQSGGDEIGAGGGAARQRVVQAVILAG